MTSEDGSLLEGLQALADSAFPKVCRNCRRVYRTPEEYAASTLPVRQGASGLKESVDDDGHPILELYRNCVCGSTLMDFFSDRRATSESGHRRREAFERLLGQLVARGIERAAARAQLLKLMRGEASELLERLKALGPG